MRTGLLLICMVIVLGALALCSSVFADEEAMSGVGGAAEPMSQHGSVRMLRENVSARVDLKTAKVHCEFVFKNDGPACTVRMGFPEQAEWVWYGHGSPSSRLSDFRSRVDGSLVKTKYQPSKRNVRRGHWYENYNAWFVKDVRFGRGQTRTVTDDYLVLLKSIGPAVSYYDVARNFTYILRSGRNWNGTIGEAVITVDTSGVLATCFKFDPSPAGYSGRAGKITWTFKDFKPVQDISLDIRPKCPSLNGQRVSTGWFPFLLTNGIVMTGTDFLRDVGASVDRNGESHVCTIIYGDKRLELRDGSPTAILNGSKRILQSSPYDFGFKHVYVIPLRAVVEALGGKVTSNTKTGYLNVELPNLGKSEE